MNNYNILQAALDKATQKGAFTLDETSGIVQALLSVRAELQALEGIRAEQEQNKEAEKPEISEKKK